MPDWKKSNLKSRAKYFEATAKQAPELDRTREDEFILNITHNGFQNTPISLLPEEAEKVVEVITTHLNKLGGRDA